MFESVFSLFNLDPVLLAFTISTVNAIALTFAGSSTCFLFVRLFIRPTPDRILATAVIFWSFIVVSMEGLSFFHRLSDSVLVILILLSIVFVGFDLIHLARRRSVAKGSQANPSGDGPSAEAQAEGGPRIASAAPAERAGWASRWAIGIALWAQFAALITGLSLPVAPASDGPIYHLPFAMRWIQDNHISLVATPFGETGATYFPGNGELWLAWLMLADGDDLAKVGQWPFGLLSALALFRLAELSGASRSAAIIMAAFFLASPLVAVSVGIPNIDLLFCFGYLAGAVFLLKASQDSQPTSLILMALALGLSLGTKSLGLVYIPLLVPAIVRQAFRMKRPIVWLLAIPALITLTGGWWYARNWIVTGNPLFPLQVEFGGVLVFPGAFSSSAMLKTSYHWQVEVWGVLVDRLTSLLDGRLLTLVAVGSAWSIARGLWKRLSGPLWLAALGVAQLALFWLVVPYNSQERFWLTGYALILASAAPAWNGSACIRYLLAGALTWSALTPTWRTHLVLPSISDVTALRWVNPWTALSKDDWPTVVPMAVGLLLVIAWSRSAPLRNVALTCLAGIALLAAAGEAQQRVRIAPRIRFLPAWGFAAELYPSWETLLNATESGARVAYAGTNLPYYLYGPARRNQPRYVNVNAPVDWLLHDYLRERRRRGEGISLDTPWPDWHRQLPDQERWLENLRREKIGYLFIARENRHGHWNEGEAGLAPFPIEASWAEQRPDLFERIGPMYQLTNGPPWSVVYRIKWPPRD